MSEKTFEKEELNSSCRSSDRSRIPKTKRVPSQTLHSLRIKPTTTSSRILATRWFHALYVGSSPTLSPGASTPGSSTSSDEGQKTGTWSTSAPSRAGEEIWHPRKYCISRKESIRLVRHKAKSAPAPPVPRSRQSWLYQALQCAPPTPNLLPSPSSPVRSSARPNPSPSPSTGRRLGSSVLFVRGRTRRLLLNRLRGATERAEGR